MRCSAFDKPNLMDNMPCRALEFKEINYIEFARDLRQFNMQARELRQIKTWGNMILGSIAGKFQIPGRR